MTPTKRKLRDKYVEAYLALAAALGWDTAVISSVLDIVL